MNPSKTLNHKTLAVLGAGSWGTAVAIHLANAHHQVFLWGRNTHEVEKMAKTGFNERYLPGIPLPPTLKPEPDLQKCLQEAQYLIIAVPSSAFMDLLSQIKTKPAGLIWLTKGLCPETNEFFHQLVARQWGEAYPVAVISGPSFAREVALGLPTAITLAGNNLAFQKAVQALLHYQNLRVYLSSDLIGVQLCGAIKNVLAIACGISDGLGFGANAKAALITRGLAEMSRLGMALGARQQTFMGLSGIGDLVLTCTDDQSRNRRFGLLIGKGLSLSEAEKSIGQVIEGRHNAGQICKLADLACVEMPICSQVQALLLNQISAVSAVKTLMNRARSEE